METMDCEVSPFDLYFRSMKTFLTNGNQITISDLRNEVQSFQIRERKSPVDHAFRDRLRTLLCNNDCIDEVNKLLQLCVASALEEMCSPVTPFLLFADVFNARNIAVCESIFEFMEETVSTVKETQLFGSGRNILLRMCNDLLRRLSKSQNTVFCGRIQLFLSRLFPLDEKSGLNLMSHFNTDNVTPYNKTPSQVAFQRQLSISTSRKSTLDGLDMDIEEGEMKDYSGLQVDYKLYLKFWSLQDYFRYPVQCYDRSKWEKFQSYTSEVLSCFSSFKLDGLSFLYTTDDANFAKYLTSEKLLDLQLMDSNFRRYILVQILILFQYLTSTVKFKSADHQLSEENSAWVQQSMDTVICLLKESSNDGPEFLQIVNHILKREEHWNQWKNEGCPSFVRNADDDTKGSITSRKRRANPLVDRDGHKIYRFANRELNRLWNLDVDNYSACRSENRLFRPSLSEYFEEARKQMDPSEKVEEQYKLINSEQWTWRTLRLLSRRCPQFYMNWSQPGKNLKEYMTVIMDKISTDNREGSNVSAQQDASTEGCRSQENGHQGCSGVDGDEDDASKAGEQAPDMGDSDDDRDSIGHRNAVVSSGRSSDREDEDTEDVPCSTTEKSDSDEMALLRNSLRWLPEEVSGSWWRLGLVMGFKEDELEYIQGTHSSSSTEAALMTLKLWLDGTTPGSRSRMALAKLLREIDLDTVAEKFEK